MSLTIRKLMSQDCRTISESFARQGWSKPQSQFEHYLAEAAGGERQILVGELDGDLTGYLSIVWRPSYPPFRDRRIPEISDLNVLIRFRRRGIATRLLDDAEVIISGRSKLAGLRVGLTSDYGDAHRLYIRRGYIPDGFGIFCQDRQCFFGDTITIDDHLTLGFTKRVGG